MSRHLRLENRAITRVSEPTSTTNISVSTVGLRSRDDTSLIASSLSEMADVKEAGEKPEKLEGESRSTPLMPAC